MAVPTRTEALALLLSTSPSPRLLQHVTVVAEVASFLAHRAAVAGLTVDRRLVEAAALLHDVDKALPPDDPVRSLGHGAAGADWLREAGHAELARPVAAHPVMQLGSPDADDWIASAPLEDRIVCYADKRATQRVVSLEARFARWRNKHPEYAERLDESLVMAKRLEADLCQRVGIRPDGVERLRWVEDVMARTESASRRAVDVRSPSAGGGTRPAEGPASAAARGTTAAPGPNTAAPRPNTAAPGPNSAA
jgi:putative nucleotidyltransferase with HDIG domain